MISPAIPAAPATNAAEVPMFDSLSELTLSMSGTPPPPAGTAPDGVS